MAGVPKEVTDNAENQIKKYQSIEDGLKAEHFLLDDIQKKSTSLAIHLSNIHLSQANPDTDFDFVQKFHL